MRNEKNEKELLKKIEAYAKMRPGAWVDFPDEKIPIGSADRYLTNRVVKHFVESRMKGKMGVADMQKLITQIHGVSDAPETDMENPKSRLLSRIIPGTEKGIQIVVAADNQKIIGIFYNRDYVRKNVTQIQNSVAGGAPIPMSKSPITETSAARLSVVRQQNPRFELQRSIERKKIPVNTINTGKDDEIFEIGPAEFPALLREINDPPKQLFVRGALPAADSVFLCVVGSRGYSRYGQEVCEFLISGLAQEPQTRRGDGSGRIVIVSGLALGIDAIAHQSALESGLPTIALPGSGLGNDVLYPRANGNLAEKILKAGGALMSEFAPDWRARPESFPQRNRIMAGLSHAVLIIEAEHKSGTMITARLATEYNRDVLTVPGSIFSHHSQGPHYLLSQGARLIASAADIIDALNLTPPPPPKETRKKSERKKNANSKTETMELFALKDSLALTRRWPLATPDELAILAILVERGEPVTKDELFVRAALPISRVNVALTLLELAGHIKINGGLARLS